MFILLNKIKVIKRFFHLLYIKTPFLGDLMIDYHLALIFQLFSTLFKSGLPINEVLFITSEVTTNVHYQESIEKIKKRVGKGTMISQAMEAYPTLYPPNVVNIVAVGEKSGTLDDSLTYLTKFYLKEVHNKTKKLPTVIEPVLLVFVGFVVGFVALSIIMPIYQLTSGLSR